jgi:alkylated DNA repair dioxygenase AlkB
VELRADSWLEYIPEWIARPEADALLAALRDELDWEQRFIHLFGREILQPRLISWCGDIAYRYSGQTLEPRPFTSKLSACRDRVSKAAEFEFNHALVNRYRTGLDSMGMHSDDEPELGRDPVVASLSLGVSRRFVIAPKRNHEKRYDLVLEHGSLLVMKGACQHHFRHGLPKDSSVQEERINVTFRRLIRHPISALVLN